MKKIDESNWTFSADPAQNEVDKVRMEVGDVDSNNKLIEDSIIQYHIDNEDTILHAAYRVATAIAASLAMHVDKSARDFSHSKSKLYEHFKDIAANLLDRASVNQIPTAPAIRLSDRDVFVTDSDIKQRHFKEGMLSVDTIPITERGSSGRDPFSKKSS